MRQFYFIIGLLLFSFSILCTEKTVAQTNCAAPIALMTQNVTQTSAILTLSPNTVISGSYNIQYQISGASTWTTVSNVTLPYTLTNITCGAIYTWQAQSICTTTSSSSPITSAWSSPNTFTTPNCTNPPTCNAPTGLSTTSVTQTGATLFLTPTSTNVGTFNIRYTGGGITTWTTLSNVTLPYQLGNLTCGSVYEWQAQAICATTGTNPTTSVSTWSTSGTFTTLACSPPPCTTPTGLSTTSVTQTGATLFLTPTSTNVGTFNIRYSGGGVTTWTTLSNVTLPYQLGNLTCGSVYEWQAQAVCPNATPNTVSTWSTSGTFTTLACSPPPCTTPTGLSTTSVTQTGATLFLTPTSTNVGTFNIRYTGGGVTAWTTLSNVTLPYQLGNLACGGSYQWQAQAVCSTTTSNTSVTSAWSTSGIFTTLACSPPPCTTPTGLSTSSVTQTGATLFLTPTSTNVGTFNIRYTGGGVTTWTTLSNVTLPYQLGNLACGGSYQWQAQAVCPSTVAGSSPSVSAWSASGTFSTLACTPVCNAPTGLSSTSVTQTGATLFLTPTSTNVGTFNIRYTGGGVTTWTTISNVTLPFNLGNLTCGSVYYWQIQKVCPNATPNNPSSWSTSGTFTTLPCTTSNNCIAPSNLSVIKTYQTTASLQWSPMSNATGFIVYYKIADAPNALYFTATTNTNNIILTGLQPGTVYVWQVQTICRNVTSPEVNTLLSTQSQFTTLSLVVAPNPVNKLVKVSFSEEQSTNTNIELRDAYGKLIYSLNNTSKEGLNEVEMNLEELTDGLYIMTVESNKKKEVSKVIVKH